MISAIVILTLAIFANGVSATTCCNALSISVTSEGHYNGGCAVWYAFKVPAPISDGYELAIVTSEMPTSVLSQQGSTYTTVGDCTTVSLSSAHANTGDSIYVLFEFASYCPTVLSGCFVDLQGPNCPTCLSTSVVNSGSNMVASNTCIRYFTVIAPGFALNDGWTIEFTTTSGVIQNVGGGTSFTAIGNSATAVFSGSSYHVNAGGNIAMNVVIETSDPSACPTVATACFQNCGGGNSD